MDEQKGGSRYNFRNNGRNGRFTGGGICIWMLVKMDNMLTRYIIFRPYQKLFVLSTVEEWAYAIGPAGYTPDPGYGEAIMAVIQKWDLD